MEEENAPAAVATEHGVVNPMTMDSNGKVAPPLGHHRREHNLQKLPKPVSNSSRHLTALLLLLAATTGQENKKSEQATKETMVVLDEGIGSFGALRIRPP